MKNKNKRRFIPHLKEGGFSPGYTKFDKALAQRFVNDMNLPIQVIDEEHFENRLLTYEPVCKSWTLWQETLQEINERFDGDASKFLEDYYNVRETVIKTVTESEAFQKFNNCDMNRFKIQTPLNPRSKDFYNGENAGKVYASFDLVKSNIQALNFADKEILFNSNTYEEFIQRFTESKYIARSKYFRQVVFGQMSPKRHITIAKYLISRVYELLRARGLDWELVAVSSDEIVFEVPEGIMWDYALLFAKLKHEWETLIYDELGLKVHFEMFRLDRYRMVTDEGNNVAEFFTKTHSNENVVWKGIPLQYYSIIYKLMNGLELEAIDKIFQYERCRCVFDEGFHIEKLVGNDVNRVWTKI